MARSHSSRSLVLWYFCCLAVLVGGWKSWERLPWNFESRSAEPGWISRYEAIRAEINESPKVLLYPEPADGQQGGAKYRGFRAQYVLSPSIIHIRNDLDAVVLRQLKRSPLILDLPGRRLNEVIQGLELRAQKDGLRLKIFRAQGIAVIRAEDAKRR